MKPPRTPKFMYAKFNSICSQTGKPLAAGDRIAYDPNTRQAFHVDSKRAEEIRLQEFNTAWNMPDANW